MSTTAQLIMDELKKNGVKFYVTVPDSLLRPLWQLVDKDPDIRMIKVCHEAEAVAVAAGLSIGGAKSVVAMENSGFFQAIEAIRALPIDMEIPMVLLLGWVGRVKPNQSADDALAHSVSLRGSAGTHVAWQGVMTEPLLDTLRIPHATLQGPEGAKLVSWAFKKAADTKQAVAILVDRMEG
ncbi:MAG: hypothetical protein HYX92_07805 [Chloroflexi bacterium]|nr:hypothetical protein [Chloroflexota bacterium]